MTISIDSNVIVALWDEAREVNLLAKQALRNLSRTHRMVVSGVVFAELMGGPQREAAFLLEFFRKPKLPSIGRLKRRHSALRGKHTRGTVRGDASAKVICHGASLRTF